MCVIPIKIDDNKTIWINPNQIVIIEPVDTSKYKLRITLVNQNIVYTEQTPQEIFGWKDENGN